MRHTQDTIHSPLFSTKSTSLNKGLTKSLFIMSFMINFFEPRFNQESL